MHAAFLFLHYLYAMLHLLRSILLLCSVIVYRLHYILPFLSFPLHATRRTAAEDKRAIQIVCSIGVNVGKMPTSLIRSSLYLCKCVCKTIKAGAIKEG